MMLLVLMMCMKLGLILGLEEQVRFPGRISEPPNYIREFPCGYIYGLPLSSGILDGKNVEVYHLNKTADKLAEEGFAITVNTVRADVLHDFTYANQSSMGRMVFSGLTGKSNSGSRGQHYVRAYYMALLGEQKQGKISWACDGVLINQQWVLSAAHCFHNSKVTPNMVRLGEYDRGREPQHRYQNQHEDYGMLRIVFHPLFNSDSRYHDLVLIQVSRPITEYTHSMNPICLPWGQQTSRNHVGRTLTLTGWGLKSSDSTAKVSHMQRVDLKVLKSSVCEREYEKRADYGIKWEFGITEMSSLCAVGNGNANQVCEGDAGGPLAYEDENERIILAGIVSERLGCATNRTLGLYTPINDYVNLEWIKKVAFNS